MRKNSLPFVWLSFAIIIIDQGSKHFALQHLTLFQPHAIFALLNFTLVFNHGAAFSFLNSQGGWQRWLFIVITIVISSGVLIWMGKTPRKKLLLSIALALVLGGALANLWDRVSLGYVVDFIDFHVNTWHWATFNIADSAVSVGVVMLVVDLLFSKKTSMPSDKHD